MSLVGSEGEMSVTLNRVAPRHVACHASLQPHELIGFNDTPRKKLRPLWKEAFMNIGNFGSDENLRGAAGEEEISARPFSTRSFSSGDVASSENSNHQPTSSFSSQRSLVAGRFMHMLHAHDDARVMFLSAHQPPSR